MHSPPFISRAEALLYDCLDLAGFQGSISRNLVKRKEDFIMEFPIFSPRTTHKNVFNKIYIFLWYCQNENFHKHLPTSNSYKFINDIMKGEQTTITFSLMVDCCVEIRSLNIELFCQWSDIFFILPVCITSPRVMQYNFTNEIKEWVCLYSNKNDQFLL